MIIASAEARTGSKQVLTAKAIGTKCMIILFLFMMMGNLQAERYLGRLAELFILNSYLKALMDQM